MSISEKKNKMDALQDILSYGHYKKAAVILKKILCEARLSEVLKIIEDFGFEIQIVPKKEYFLKITRHAKERLISYTGKEHSNKEIVQWIAKGHWIEYSDLLALGYRPSSEHKENSSYIILNDDLIAVICFDESNEEKREYKHPTLVTFYLRKKNHPSFCPMSHEDYLKMKKR